MIYLQNQAETMDNGRWSLCAYAFPLWLQAMLISFSEGEIPYSPSPVMMWGGIE